MALARHARTAAAVAGVVAATGALAWAAVPLGNVICQVSGCGTTTEIAVAAPGIMPDRPISVRFDASRAGSTPWTFKPARPAIASAAGGRYRHALRPSYIFYEVRGENGAADAKARAELARPDPIPSNEL